MNEFWIVYWAMRIVALPEILGTIAMTGAILYCAWVLLVVTEGYMSEDKEAAFRLRAKRWGSAVGVFVAIAILAWTFIPTKEDLSYIIGGGLALKASKNEEAQQLPENIVRAINNFLAEK